MNKRLSILMFTLIVNCLSYGQGVSNLFQQILDHPEFISLLNKDSSLLCNQQLLIYTYNKNLSDTNLDLFFKGEPTLIYSFPSNINCSYLSFSNIVEKKRFTVTATITNHNSITGVGNCVFKNFVEFICKVKLTNNGYKILKTDTQYLRSVAKTI